MKVKITNIKIFFFTLLLVRPQILIYINQNIKIVYAACQLLVIFWILLKKRKSWSPIAIIGITFYLYETINTMLQTRFLGYFYTAITGIYTLLILEACYSFYGKEGLFKGVANSLLYILVINFVLTFSGVSVSTISASQERRIYFLGIDNQIACYILVGLYLQYINYIVNSLSKRRFVCSTLLILLNLIYFASSTLIICVAAISLLFIISELPKWIRKYITPKTVAIGLAVLFILVTFRQRFEFMEHFIALLGKNMTLSGRTAIWNKAYDLLGEGHTFLLGLGERVDGAYIKMPSGNQFSAHNLFLQLMLTGGIVLTILYLSMWSIAFKKVIMLNDTKQRAFISSFISVYLLACMTEVFPMNINILIIHITYLCALKSIYKGQVSGSWIFHGICPKSLQ